MLAKIESNKLDENNSNIDAETICLDHIMYVKIIKITQKEKIPWWKIHSKTNKYIRGPQIVYNFEHIPLKS